MTLNIIYRSAEGNSQSKIRPDYFSKTTCLKSFLLAVEQISAEHLGEVIFLNDGDIQDERKELMMRYEAELMEKQNMGNSGSFRTSLQLIEDRGWERNELVYFAEDDYLYSKDAFIYLLHAAEDITSAHYFTLYDHPDRYRRTDNADKKKTRVFLARDRHWRTSESTCISFGARVGALEADMWIFKAGTWGETPKDREIFRACQGLGKYWWRLKKHRLVSPIPGLCTHMEKHHLAPFVDWEKIASDVEKKYMVET